VVSENDTRKSGLNQFARVVAVTGNEVLPLINDGIFPGWQVIPLRYPFRSRGLIRANLVKAPDWPTLRVCNRIPKHLDEDALGEGVELGEGGAALGAQGLGLIQDRRDAALLGEGREIYLMSLDI